MNANEGLQARDVLSIVGRRAPLAAAVAGAMTLSGIFVAAVLPNRYEAWTTLLVAPQTISKRFVEAGFEESDLNNRLNRMTMQILSRGRLSKIIDEFKLYPKESKTMTREEVIDVMRDDIRVEPVVPELEGKQRRNAIEEIDTFRLFYRSRSAEVAAAVASRLANDYIDEHIRERVDVSSSTSEFIESELDRLAGEIRQVEEQIAGVKNENTGSLPEDLDANQRLLERTTSDLRLAQRDLALAESDEAFYRQQAVTGATLSRGGGADLDTPQERLQRLELSLGEYAARGLTDKHPDVIAAKDEIASLREKLKTASEEDSSQSPEQALALNEAKRADLRVEAGRQEVARLQAAADDVQDRIAKTPRVAEQLTGLERQHDHLYESFREFSNKRLEAGVSANMERKQKGEQFRILEAAFPPPEPSSPNRPVIVLLGLLLGLAAGGGAALLREVADTSLHGPREVQAIFQVPVLASIPKVLLEFDRARLRRQRLVAGALAMGITMVALVGAGAGYVLVNGKPGFLAGSQPSSTDTPAGATGAPAAPGGQG